jgi:3-oxo-5-alpha-steroid 4-dehydrogenase 1
VKELTIFNGLLIGWFVLGAVTFVALFFVAAPYGRHIRRGWGHTINNKIGWVLMEAPAPLVFLVCFILGDSTGAVAIILLILWEVHYLHRAFIYPFGLRGATKRLPLVVMSFGILFNVMNGYLNGRHIFTLSGGYDNQWLSDPRFILGTLLFVIGFTINRQADKALHDLRQPDESGYKISYSRLYRWVSSPNYLGEIIIWTGWAMATWSLPGLAFAFWTAANLIPRAKAHHDWYRRTFPDYPPERKALLPGIW